MVKRKLEKCVRIADGYYFVKSILMLQYLFHHPELLEEEANKTINME